MVIAAEDPLQGRHRHDDSLGRARRGAGRAARPGHEPTDETWTGLNVYPFLSRSDRTSARSSWQAAVRPEISSARGSSRPAPSTTASTSSSPGRPRAGWSRFPRPGSRTIDGTEGVYWIGVHVLGRLRGTRRPRRRSGAFVHPARAATGTPASPTRSGACRSAARSCTTPTGGSPASTSGRRAAQGRATGEPARPSRRAGTGTLSLLVDPAVLDAVGQLADGNPERDSPRPPTRRRGATRTHDCRASRRRGSERRARRRRAEASPGRPAWLAGSSRQSDDTVLALPYGDLDSAARRAGPRGSTRPPASSPRTCSTSWDIAATPPSPRRPACSPPRH